MPDLVVGRPLATPYLSQVNGQPNQEMNCVPTVLSMMTARFNPRLAARANGNGDALIATISAVMRTLDGSVGVSGLASYQTLGVLGRELGLLLQRRPGIDCNELAMQLGSGKQAILVGNAYALPYATRLQAVGALFGGEDAGHVIAVTGYDATKRAFVVNDPADPKRTTTLLAPEDLIAFVGMLHRDLDGGAEGSTIYVSASPWQ